MTYVADLNALFRQKVLETPGIVCYGQNIVAGSCLSGLTRGLAAGPGGLVFNSPNSENALVGLGMGLSLRGVPAIFFMKQLDFLLLGIDHLVNTWNVLRMRAPSASFTIVAIVVDSGFEGPQSCFNGFPSVCSIAHVPGYTISSRQEAEWIVGEHLVAPGFRIIGVSQRLWSTETLVFPGPIERAGALFRYATGSAATIAAFNFALPQASQLADRLADHGGASLFGVPAQLPESFAPILEDARRTRRLVVVDDSRSAHRASDALIAAAHAAQIGPVIELRRRFETASLRPNLDLFAPDLDGAVGALGLNRPGPKV